MPGSSLPSRYSSEAPPPVEMWVILSPRPICWTAAALSAAADDGGSVALSHSLGHSQGAGCQGGVLEHAHGPFQTTVLEALTASANSFMVSGPMSQPSMSAGILSMG